MNATNLITIDIPQSLTKQFIHIAQLLNLNLIQCHSGNIKCVLQVLSENEIQKNLVIHFFDAPFSSLETLDAEVMDKHLHIAICPNLTTELEVAFISSGFHCSLENSESEVDKINAIKQIQSEDLSFSHKAMSRYILSKKRSPALLGRTKVLSLATKKEKQVLLFIWDGHSNEEIGQKMGISVNTVKMHVQNIYKKTNISNRGQLFALTESQ